MDPTDFVGQLALSILIGEEPKSNYVSLSKMAPANGLDAYAALIARVSKGKTSKPPNFPLRAYQGCYWNAAQSFYLEITATANLKRARLVMQVQKSSLNTYHLEPYDGDTFYWPPDREKELCEQGMWFNLSATSREIVLGTSEDGQSISYLTWHHDPADTTNTRRAFQIVNLRSEIMMRGILTDTSSLSPLGSRFSIGIIDLGIFQLDCVFVPTPHETLKVILLPMDMVVREVRGKLGNSHCEFSLYDMDWVPLGAETLFLHESDA